MKRPHSIESHKGPARNSWTAHFGRAATPERAERIAAGEIVELTICVGGDQCVEAAKARALREHLAAHPEHMGKAVTYVVDHIITGVPRLPEGI